MAAKKRDIRRRRIAECERNIWGYNHVVVSSTHLERQVNSLIPTSPLDDEATDRVSISCTWPLDGGRNGWSISPVCG
jgi:hypothetical protein